MASHLEDHIDLIARHEQEFMERRTTWERTSDAVAVFIGSRAFILLHLALFAVWVGWNIWPGAHHFDPRPFALLQTMMACEAILVASVILMRQTRLGKRSDEREHLMLQVLLIAEKEITAVLGINRELARHAGLKSVANDADVRELSEDTPIDAIAQTIQENLSPE